MAEKINILPPVLDISFYAGDGVKLKLVCLDDEEPPGSINITGDVDAQIRLDRGSATPVIVEFSSDMTEAANGVILLSLTGEQTQELVDHESTKKGKFSGVWDVEWEPTGSEPRTLIQGDVECMADVTR